MTVLEGRVIDGPGRVLASLFASTHQKLGMGLRDVVALEEGLLGHLPVGVENDLLPPLDPHIAHADAVEQLGDRRKGFHQLWGVQVHVDPYVTGPGLHQTFAKT